MNLLQTAGAQPNKQPKYVPIFMDRTFTGIWTQRSVLHDPSDIATAHFYGGRPDALWSGSNVELTNDLTLKRRPGLSAFSTALYPTPPSRAFSFELTNGTIQVIVDTGTSPTFNLSAVDMISGTAFYHFTTPQTCGSGNAYMGLIFTVAGFDNATNNGSYLCTGSTSTYLILANATAVTDTFAATAVSAGGVYWDTQSGGESHLLFPKSAGAGQTGFTAVAGTLYMGDGVDTRKYTPLNNNGSIAGGTPNGDPLNKIGLGYGSVWNYSISAPVNQPVVTTVESGLAAVSWMAATFYSTMGLLVDANNNIQFLTGVNNSGTNTTQYGKTGQGQPIWSNISGNPPSSGEDGTCNWLCTGGPLQLWAADTAYAEGQCIYIPGIGGTPLPVFSGNGKGVYCNGTTGGGIFQCFPNAGTSGSSEPTWGTHVGDGHVNDHNIDWQYLGPAMLWQPNYLYNSWWEHLPQMIVEPTLPNLALLQAGTQNIYVQTNNNQSDGENNVPGTSGSGYVPPWPPSACSNPSSVGQTTGDGDLQWICLGCANWIASTEYTAWIPGATLFSTIKDSNGNFQVAIQGGLSGTTAPLNGWTASTTFATNAIVVVKFSTGNVSFKVTGGGGGKSGSSNPSWNKTTGATTSDGALTWTSQGLLASTVAVWGQSYGAQTGDGTVIWSCVGTAADSTWTVDTQWYLPAIGFAAPTSSQAYAGPEVIANGDVQITIASGLSGSSQPHWGAIGTTTQDNFAVWYTDSAQSANSLAWSFGHVYAYSYKSRELDDFYSVKSYVYTGPGQSTFQIPIPPGLNSALPAPTGSETGGISTSSPVFTIIGANTGAVNGISVTGSLDPQVDTIVIWRDADGGGPDNMFELTEIPNPKPVNGAPGIAVFQDYLPDVAFLSATGVLYPGLDNEVQAPIDDSNDPPPSTFIPQVYNFQRIWGANGQNVPWSGGPDVVTGNPNEAYNPSDFFPYLASVTRVIRNSQGLVVLITDSVEFIGGGPQTNSFYQVTLAQGIGLNNFNAADIYAGDIFFVSSDSQMKSINPALALSNLGFPIGDQIALMNSSTVEVAVQQAGVDNAIYIADGSTGWWRCNPRQIPGGVNGPEPVWSPFATVASGDLHTGAGMVQSVEISPGIKKLLVGGTGCNQNILERNLNVYTDNGTMYDAYFVMGSIMLCHPGQMCVLKFIEGDFSGVKYQPTISYLLNEISGAFTAMPIVPQFDPPSLYGTALSPQSYSPNRYYFSGTGSLARCRHLQIRVDFGQTSNGDELYNLTIFGRLLVEN
jgi:hypothetical protein